MKEQEAVNLLLRLIGATQVNDPTVKHPDVDNARTVLARTLRRVLRHGWWFNIEYNTKFTVQGNGEVDVPSAFLHILFCDRRRHVVRSGKVYDVLQQTFKHSAPVEVTKLITALEWDDIPETAQDLIAYSAGKEFVWNELEDKVKADSVQEHITEALLQLNKEDLEASRYNMFEKPRVIQAGAGVQPYARNNRRFYGDPDV